MHTAIYLRVSTEDQESGMDSQRDALMGYLRNKGWEATEYADRCTGAKLDRPQFKLLCKHVNQRRVKTVIVWKLDRLSRSLRDGINLLTDWLEKGVRVISITQDLDFRGAMGKLLAGLLFALAEMERENLRENIKRGIKRAQEKGIRCGGGKRGRVVSITPQRRKSIIELWSAGHSARDVASSIGISRQSVYNILRESNEQTTEF